MSMTPFNYHSLPTDLAEPYIDQINKTRDNVAWFWVTTGKDTFAASIGARTEMTDEEMVNFFLTENPSITDPKVQDSFTRSENKAINNISHFLLATKPNEFEPYAAQLCV